VIKTVAMTENNDTLLEFPCDFPIKAIGKSCENFDAMVFNLVSPHAPDLGEGAIITRTSAQGNYLSVTVMVRATSREQLDTIYRELTACEQIMMVF